MAQSEKKTEVQTEELESKKDGKSHSVADYLQAPRRKRRSYIVTALGAKTSEYQGSIESYIRGQFQNASVMHLKTVEDLLRAFKRQLLLAVIDDEFADRDVLLNLIARFKTQNANQSIPFLFLTKTPDRLIEGYGRILQPFQEGDDYINYTKFGISHITSRIRAGLLTQYKRRSRRYKIDINLKYFLLADDQMHSGRIVDLSVHGGLIESRDDHVFRMGEQLTLHLPVQSRQVGDQSEFLHIPCRVRRVLISGNVAGVSFEHLSEAQCFAITVFITELSRAQIMKRVPAPKAQAGRR